MARNLGMVTAYAYAVAGGYTGTEAEFEELLGNIADDLSQIENLSVTVTTLTPGSSATASYSNGVLALGIPRGNTGATGNGISAIIKTGTSGLVDTYTVTYTNGQTMTYTVTNGAKGDTGNGIASIALTSTSGAVKTYTVTFTDGSTFTFDVTDGEVTNASLAEALEDFSANGTVANAEQLTTDIRANDQTPYLFRTAGGSVDIGDREYINGIVGGTVAFNQLVATLRNSASLNGLTITADATNMTVRFAGESTQKETYTCGGTVTSGVVPANHVVIGFAGVNKTASYSPNVGAYTPPLGADGVIIKSSGSALAVNLIVENGVTIDITVRPMLIDLTQMFGSTIADYIYSLEQATAGAGVAFFKTLFPKPYYAYNAGELMSVKGLVSHDMVGFNQWDGVYENGYLDPQTGEEIPVDTTYYNSKRSSYIDVVGGATYYFRRVSTGVDSGVFWFYDADKNAISSQNQVRNGTFNAPTNARYMRWAYINMNIVENDICINLSWDGSRNGEYEPYQKWSYPLDSDLELRGIPKIENGNLYYDGDVYEPDGTVTRKYGIVDLGSLTWSKWNNDYKGFYAAVPNSKGVPQTSKESGICSKYAPTTYTGVLQGGSDKSFFIADTTHIVYVGDSALQDGDADAFKVAMSGIYLVYELATSTEESADPYTSPQIVSDFGTEEYVIDDDVFAIPVGHNTDYPVDLKAKLEMAPNSPPGDGMYVVKQTSGTNEYVPLIIPSGIPPVPTENGSYTLTATVSGGTTTLSWS